MSSLAATLTLLWALQEPAPVTTGPSCERTDNACKAKLFVKKAATAEPAKRARYLFSASRSYLALFAQTGDVQDLCAARRNFEQSLAVPEQTASQRASFEESRTELEALEQKHGARCRPSNRRKKSEPIAVAQSTPAATPPVADSGSSTQTPASSPAPVPLELLVSSPQEPTAADEALLPVPTTATAAGPAPPPAAELPRRRPTARIAAGSSLLVAGVGFAGGLAVSMVLRDRMNDTIVALDASATAQGRDLTSQEIAAVNSADAGFVRLGHAGAAFGTAAGLSLLTGVVLLALPPKARVTSRVRPVGAGIRLTF